MHIWLHSSRHAIKEALCFCHVPRPTNLEQKIRRHIAAHSIQEKRYFVTWQFLAVSRNMFHKLEKEILKKYFFIFISTLSSE